MDIDLICRHFKDHYPGNTGFVEDEQYRPYFDLCMEALEKAGFIGNIKFCNDLFQIPPVKTFLLFYKNRIYQLAGGPQTPLPLKVKQGIGAFWGVVFRYLMGYQKAERASVNLKKDFGVQTASYFVDQDPSMQDEEFLREFPLACAEKEC